MENRGLNKPMSVSCLASLAFNCVLAKLGLARWLLITARSTTWRQSGEYRIRAFFVAKCFSAAGDVYILVVVRVNEFGPSLWWWKMDLRCVPR